MKTLAEASTQIITGLGIAALLGIGVYSNFHINSQERHEAALDQAVSEVFETAHRYHMGEESGKVATDAATEWNKTGSPVKVSVETSKQFVIVQASGYGLTDMKTDASIAEGEVRGQSTESRLAQMKAERNLEVNSSNRDGGNSESSSSIVDQNAPENRAAEIQEAAGTQ